jgi:ion channel-forming bestrophin family protein
MPATEADKNDTVETRKARVLIEKKTVLNLLEAFSVSVKHYLRGEDGIHYVDLYHLVKFLPSYALPAGIPSMADLGDSGAGSTIEVIRVSSSSAGAHDEKDTDLGATLTQRLSTTTAPIAPTSPSAKKTTFADAPAVDHPRPSLAVPNGYRDERMSMMSSEENFLLPARMPPKYHLFDIFPFSLLVKYLTKRGKDVKGKKGARLRARLRNAGSHNLPLEITLYLVRATFFLCI